MQCFSLQWLENFWRHGDSAGPRSQYDAVSKLLLFCVPLALGMAGFQCAGGVRMADALYFCVCMYVLGSTTAST